MDLAVSNDGGNSFQFAGEVAKTDQYPAGGTWGVFEPSNIIKRAASGFVPPAYYSLVWVSHPSGSGIFLMKTHNLADPSFWRFLTTEGSIPTLNFSYKPSSITGTPSKGGISYNNYLKKYLGVYSHWNGIVYYSLSDDLLNWTENWRGERVLTPPDVGPKSIYASLLQPGAETRNFETTDRSPYIYVFRYRSTYDRDLIRIRIRLSKWEDVGKYELLDLRFQEKRGGKTLDSSFYGNDGLLSGNYIWSQEGEENFLALRDGFVHIPHKSSLNGQNTLTITAKIRLGSPPPSGVWYPLAAKENSTSRNYGFYIAPKQENSILV